MEALGVGHANRNAAMPLSLSRDTQSCRPYNGNHTWLESQNVA